MQLDEALQRIFRRHRLLIVVTVLLGLAVPLGIHVLGSTTYTATARVTLDASNPKSAGASTALADAATGIVTGPGRVAGALRKARAHRNADDFAANDVAVHAVGSSGVLELSVSDPKPRVAAVVANALADELVAARRQAAEGTAPALVASLDAQIAAASQRIVDLEAAFGASAATAGAKAAQSAVLGVEHNDVLKERSDLESQRRVLLGAQTAPTGSRAPLAQLIAAVNTQLTAADQRLGSLDTAIASTDPNSSRAKALGSQHDEAQRERTILDAERQRLLVLQANETVASTDVAQLLDSLNTQIDGANQRLSELETASAAAADPQGASTDLLRIQHDTAVQERSRLEVERQRLVDSQALRAGPAIIDPAKTPTQPTPSLLAPELALGALLGLVLGMALAGAVEVLRPSVVGPNALVRLVEAPVLATLSCPPDSESLADAGLARQLQLASACAGVKVVRLTGAGPTIDLPRVAESLRTETLGAPDVVVAEPQPSLEPLTNVSAGTSWNALTDRHAGPTALVLVAPWTVTNNELDPLRHLLALTRWPLLGVVIYKPRRARDKPTVPANQIALAATDKTAPQAPLPVQ